MREMHSMKSKLSRLGREKTTEDDEKLPEDYSEDDQNIVEGKESKRRRLKQKLVYLRRRLAEDLLDELPRDRLRARITRLADKLKRDDDDECVFEDTEDLSEGKMAKRLKKKFVELGGKLRFDNDDPRLKLGVKEDDDEDEDSFKDCEESGEKLKMSAVLKEKMTAFSDRLSKRDGDGKCQSDPKNDDYDKGKPFIWESSDADLTEHKLPTDADSISVSGSEGSAAQLQTESIFEKIGQRLTNKVYRYFQRGSKLGDVNRRLKSQIWSSVVTIVLVEGKNLQPMDMDGFSDPYVKFRLANEKFKSKVVYKSLNPSWLEQFDLHLYDDQNQELELTVWDKDRSKDDFMGRCAINLSTLEREKTHNLWQELEDGAGSIHLLLTISGTTASETISDLTTYEENARERTNIANRYSLLNTFHNLRDVGHLTVKVFRAAGLAAADLGGKSDPFCVLELVNARLQTQTEYKTLCPSWQKIFTFNVKDINSVLEVTVYDEDRDHKVEFLGRLAIPLLRIRNHEKRWYCLKDKKLTARAKGSCPMILLEMAVIWNPFRACIRTLNPKEEKLMQAEVKFKRQVFVRNVLRLKAIIVTIIDWGKLIQDCFEWERPAQSAIALVLFIALCYYFEPYMILASFLLIFLRNYIVHSLTNGRTTTSEDDDDMATCDEDDDDDDKDKEEKKSLKERLQAIQEVTQSVQNAIGYIASLGEQIKNTFNFSVPFVTWLAIALTITGMLVVYFVPVRYLIMIGGVNKFARKLIRPHTIPNNEILDLLSRVPDDEQLIAYKEFKPYPSDSSSERARRRKHVKTCT